MIKLGKMTDYAVAIMVQLSRNGEALSSAQLIAKKIGVPEPTVAKVLKRLTRHKLAVSVRGAAGGYRIARAAGGISVADIVTAIEGPMQIVSCVSGNAGKCRSEHLCPARGQWDRVNDAIQQALESVNLSEMGAGGCAGRVLWQ